MVEQADKQKIHILVVDDDEDDFFITRELIEQIPGYHYEFLIDWCPGYATALDKICNGSYDIYFVDYRLGAKTGLDLIRAANEMQCEQPIVLLTGKGNREIDLQAMQAGAVDYLIKSELNPEKLERCIRYALARHASAKALKANEQKYRGIFEKSKDCVFVTGTDFKFAEVNSIGTDLLGYSRQELMTMNLKDLISSEADALFIERETATKGVVLDREINLTCKNADIIPTVLSVTREEDAEGNYYLQGIIHDISGLKKAEKITLQTEKFKAAERLVRMLAHEVRNPLNNILLAAEHLGLDCKDSAQQTLLQIITRNSGRINNIITELMDASRSGEIKKERIALQSVIDDSLHAASDRITLKRIQLKKNYMKEDAWIMADAAKLKIAFLNIIINALEAIPEDSGMLEILMEPNHSSYRILIIDNGHGIKEDELNRIFDPYYTSKNNGMGLGLASVLNIMRSHGALIEVKSRLGLGTSFIINFEIAQS